MWDIKVKSSKNFPLYLTTLCSSISSDKINFIHLFLRVFEYHNRSKNLHIIIFISTSSVNARFAMSISNRLIANITGVNLMSISFWHRKNNIRKAKETSTPPIRNDLFRGHGWNRLILRKRLETNYFANAFGRDLFRESVWK